MYLQREKFTSLEVFSLQNYLDRPISKTLSPAEGGGMSITVAAQSLNQDH